MIDESDSQQGNGLKIGVSVEMCQLHVLFDSIYSILLMVTLIDYTQITD